MLVAPFEQLFRTLLPARAARCEIALVPEPEVSVRIDSGSLFATVVLVIFEADQPGVPRDAKVQELYLGAIEVSDVTRALSYIEGHLRALPEMLERLRDDVETCMPMDVLGYPEALEDRSLVTTDDFARAFRDPERVAGWHEARLDAEWEDNLAGVGLGGRAAEVRALARASIRLRATLAEDEPAIGASRIGGAPDLPASMPWPDVDGQPLAFVAQIDLASLAEEPGAAELPDEGLLSFFYSQNTNGRGNPVAVFHIIEPGELARRVPPPQVEQVPEHEVETENERMFPPVVSPFYEALLPLASRRAFRYALKEAGRGGGAGPVIDPLRGIDHLIVGWNDIDDDRPMHRLLGYASSIQGDPYVDHEVDVVRGGYDGWEDDSDEALGLLASARRWRLLLQIDASGDGDLVLNQDGGFFYFWISEEALRAHEWSQVRGSLQCH